MIVFRTDVSQYTVRSGPEGPGPHIRRVHFNRPDRYNFFREIRDFSCAGEGSPLIWHWPRGGEVVSADITSIEVHTPNGQVRYDPERDRLRRERTRRIWEDAPEPSMTVAANSTFGTMVRGTYAAPRPYEAELRDMRARINDRVRTTQRQERVETWTMYLMGIDTHAREQFIGLANENGLCSIDCQTCMEELANLLVNGDYVCPLGMWEMELMERPYENLIDMVRPPQVRRSVTTRDFISPLEQGVAPEDGWLTPF